MDANWAEVKRDDSVGLVIRQDMSGALPKTYSVITCDVPLSKWRQHFNNWVAVQNKRDDKVTCTDLGTDEGAIIYHQHLKTPFIMNDKEHIAAAYLVDTETEVTFVVSTTGNEAMYEKYADKLNKKRDRGNVNVFYFNLKEVDGKVHFSHIVDMHPGGNLPGPAKGKMQEKHQSIATELVKLVGENYNWG